MPTQTHDGKTLLTPEQAKAALDAAGISVQEFARKNNLHPKTVYEVLAGRKKGRRGEAHRAAVLLGLKEGVISK